MKSPIDRFCDAIGITKYVVAFLNWLNNKLTKAMLDRKNK